MRNGVGGRKRCSARGPGFPDPLMLIPDSDSEGDGRKVDTQPATRAAKSAALANKAWLAGKALKAAPTGRTTAAPPKAPVKPKPKPTKAAPALTFKPAVIDSGGEEGDEEGEDAEHDEDDGVESGEYAEDEEAGADEDDAELDDDDLLEERPRVITAKKRAHAAPPSTPPKKRQSKVLSSSPPATAAELFDDSEDDDNPGPLSSPKGKPSSGRKRLQSVDSSDVVDLSSSPVPKKKSRRDEAFVQEKPRIKVSPLKKKLAALSPRKNRKVKATNANTSHGSSAYPQHASLVYNAGTTEVPLLRQHTLIRRTAREAIKSVTEHLVLERAWEKDAINREGQGPKVLRDACRSLSVKYPSVKDIYDRLKEDDIFARHLSQLPMDRLSTLRGPAKAEADLYISYFKLGLGEECKARVDALFKKHGYIFPGQWDSASESENVWLPDKTKPYGNPTLAYILKSGFFRSPTSTGSTYADRFPEHDGKRQLTKSLLALAATGLYASLLQQQVEGTAKRVRFHGNSFAAVYNTHFETLEMMEQQKPSAYHRIMADLYIEVRGGRSEEVSGNDDIYSVCDLD